MPSTHDRPRQGRRRAACSIAAAALLAASAPVLLLAPSAAAADGDGSQLSRESLITLEATPAVQMVLAEFSATVSIPNWDIDRPAWAAEAEAATSVQDVVDAVVANPGKFFVPAAEPRTKQSSATFQGTGFLVTPDGYVVTNAHVAAPSEDALKDELSQGVLADIQKEDIASIASESGSDTTFTQAQRQALAEAVASLDAQQMSVSNVAKTFAVVMGAGAPGLGSSTRTLPAELTLAGEEAPGKDVAILKIAGTNLITVPLGDDAGLTVADRLYVVGYPGDAKVSEASALVPTLTTGTVSARKTLDNGLTVIQTDAAINHGNSGGPVLDADGQVVGIATFGRVDASGSKVAGLNFVYPVSLIREMLARANVTPSAGITTPRWAAALEDYDRSWFTRALPEFQAVDELVPGTPLVAEYLSKTQAAIADGKDRTPSTILGLPAAAVIGAGAVLGLALVGLVVVLALRARRPAAAVASPSPPPPPPHAAGPPVAMTPLPPMPPPAAEEAPAIVGAPAAAAATAEHGRFCSECGAEHEAGAHFCPDCGHRLG